MAQSTGIWDVGPGIPSIFEEYNEHIVKNFRTGSCMGKAVYWMSWKMAALLAGVVYAVGTVFFGLLGVIASLLEPLGITGPAKWCFTRAGYSCYASLFAFQQLFLRLTPSYS